jgi:glycosyltransferase involved in cell wall biosynthesis
LGIEWFLRHVWPAIREKDHQVRFRIVGSRLRPDDQKAWSKEPGVDVVGFVQDLASAYRECSFVVVPVWSGGGTNIKVLEALMYGRACIISEPASRGYGKVFDGADALAVAGNAEEMIRHCTGLLGSPSRCRSMGERGAAMVAREYSYQRFQQVVLRTVESTLRGQRRGFGGQMQ